MVSAIECLLCYLVVISSLCLCSCSLGMKVSFVDRKGMVSIEILLSSFP